MNIWFATNNNHKNEELQAILNRELKIPSNEGLTFNPVESGSTFIENTLIKARELHKLLENKNPVIADDSGLCVDALGGRPGVHSAYYGYTDDKKLTSHEQNIMLLNELGDNPNRSARFVCSMVLYLSNDRFYLIQETLEGKIVQKNDMRGDGGFGYDPIFFLPEFNRTLAELSAEEKNTISHRGKAGKLIAKIINNL
ncbi:MAG: RdgB/HAM1 family non-canonical purine NTP pyrophosphatase [Treponema sp.]|nr:RdgB/HAM1 family non-canonical purine NTP pyrophosphatase [Treponema sp.]